MKRFPSSARISPQMIRNAIIAFVFFCLPHHNDRLLRKRLPTREQTNERNRHSSGEGIITCYTHICVYAASALQTEKDNAKLLQFSSQ